MYLYGPVIFYQNGRFSYREVGFGIGWWFMVFERAKALSYPLVAS